MPDAHTYQPRDNNGPQTPLGPWRIQDIIYVGIVGSVMLAALLEWILWLLAFLYCLVKVYQKADGQGSVSIRVLAVVNMIFFTLMRCIFLPIMIVTLPLPRQIVQHFPEGMIGILQWFAFWTFAGLLIIPWLFCVYQLVTHNIGRTRRIKTVLDEHSAPKVVICMPCYCEEPEVLLRTVDSIVDCDYPPSCLHIFLSFDGEQEDELYLNTIEQLGVPITIETYPRSIDVTYRSCRITVSRFGHGGKRNCQKKTFELINKVYAEYLRRNDNMFLLFIDSDCILDRFCIQNFIYEMELKPGSKRNMLAMTGVITSTTQKNSIITVLQDMEYVHGQLFERTVESGCGAVTCLPGALTILRFSAFRRMAKYYFADKAEQCDDLFDFGKCHLGEDRWLTHLFMIGARERYQIQMNTGAFCKTEAVQNFKSLLKQRRRWFLGFITNEACMLTDIRLWKRYPLLVMIRLAQNTIRTTALLFFIMVISIITTSQKITNLPVGFIAVSLGLNWILMLYFAAKLGRFKIVLYPLMFLINPFFNWLYMVYGIFTAGQRTWGGPRADAGKADEKTSPEQAIEHAAAQGDELNVVPETFRPALQAARRRLPRHTPLLPSESLEGRFVPAEELAGGWYRQSNDSDVLRRDTSPRRIEEGRMYSYDRSRGSTDSYYSTGSANHSIYTPRRVESIIGAEDAVTYYDHQAHQRPAGGAHFENFMVENTVPAFSNAPLHSKNEYAGSMRSLESESSISLHFNVPTRRPNMDFSGPGATASPPVRPPVHSSAAYIGVQPSNNHPNPSLPTAPSAVHRSNDRYLQPPQSSSSRTGPSPLARKSFTRLATDDTGSAAGEKIELSDRVPRRHSIAGGERRGRRSVSIDRQGRRRLSKQRPPARSSSHE
ncbi:hypothetical protein LTR37_011738 [Vermiconidia calcicola]|uniref:Uncharacterized protein n=1 Tax=Vermiconidia calcicola TaxID=1690605 RepID=A0ACC3N1A6_9PEZI|nr:hypothetical protein LTR37_011738 [Vermiconidia calcicola]